MKSPKKTLKVVHILYSGQGGLGTYFINFVRSDEENNFEHYAFFYGKELLADEYRHFCLSHGIIFLYFERKRKIDFGAFKTCRNFIRDNDIKYALLHTFSMTPFYWKIGQSTKVISIDHTPYQVKTKLEWAFTAINHLFTFKSVYFYKEQFNHLKSFFLFLNSESNTHYIPKAIDPNWFKPVEERLDGIFTIGITARIIKGKRHDLIIGAVEVLNNSGIDVLLKIAGAGSELESYKRFVQDKQLEHCVEFAGMLSQVELVKFYQSLSAYVHASDGETNCYCIMEAQASGLPIIASNVEGINNVIFDETNGVLFKNEIASIAGALKGMIGNKSKLEALKVASRTIAIQNAEINNPSARIFSMLSNEEN